MRQAGQVAVWVGLASVVVGIVSRLIYTPVIGIEAHAFLDFAQTCFLFAIAVSLGTTRG